GGHRGSRGRRARRPHHQVRRRVRVRRRPGAACGARPVNFSAWAIHKPAPSILLFVMLGVAGLIAFQGLGVMFMPDLEFPAVTLHAHLPGASPVQLESEVARPIEDSIASVGDVRHVTTTINDGVVSMMVEFGFNKNLQEAVTDVRDAITRIRSTLPAE